MAEPPPPPAAATMTITVDIPMLANIFQSTHDLRTEVHSLQLEIRDLRTDFSTRLEAVEAQLAQQPTIQSPSNAIVNLSQDLVEDTTVAQEEDRLDEEDLHVQMDDRLDHDDLPQQGDIVQEDEDIVTQEDIITRTQNIVRNHEEIVTHTQQDNGDRESLAHEDGQGTVDSSSPSVDRGITGVAEPVISLPPAAAGIKRKRTIHDAPAYINRSGFMTRSSDAQVAEKRNGEAKGPSRSKSPFDNNDDRDESLDGVDEIPPKPPVRPQLPPSTSTQTVPPRRPRAEEARLDEFVTPKAEDFTIRTAHNSAPETPPSKTALDTAVRRPAKGSKRKLNDASNPTVDRPTVNRPRSVLTRSKAKALEEKS
ncbi:hypothetical protein KCU73_g6174, partial [Aureobasidium melanogenum]